MSLLKVIQLDQKEKVTNDVCLKYPTVKDEHFFPPKGKAELKAVYTYVDTQNKII